MTKFEYGLAYQADGLIEAHPQHMKDMVGAEQNYAPFLHKAGDLGWELCTLLPGKEGEEGKNCLVFKRPREN